MAFNLIANEQNRITAQERLNIVSSLLANDQGRFQLAASMAEPLREYRDYTGIGRRAFQIDELGQGELAYYDKDIQTPSYIVSEEGTDVQVVIRAERVFVPLFEIATNLTIPITQIRERRYDLQSRVKTKSRTEMIRKEDQIIFGMFDKISKDPKTFNPIQTVARNDLSIADFSKAKGEIEKWGDVNAHYMFINPKNEHTLRIMNAQNNGYFIDFETTRQLLNQGYIGTLYGMQILKSPEVPENKIYITAEPEFFGKLVIGQDITVLCADEPKDRKIGFSIYEQLGILIHNTKGLATIEITE